jgi:hypothetical protein
MKLVRTTHFVRSYTKAPKQIQQAFDKQSLLLLQNLRHPSLHEIIWPPINADTRR